MEHFGTRLKRFRDARCWSQEQLGFELDVTKATISNWEAGQAQPRCENLAHLRRLVAEDSLTLNWLIDGILPGKGADMAEARGYANRRRMWPEQWKRRPCSRVFAR